MIVGWDELPELAGKVVMVDGGFDPLHDGHVAYFEAAATLGLPILCNVSGDDWVGRKHPPLLTQDQRVRVIDAFRAISYTHASAVSTAEVLAQLRPRTYAKGADWRGSLPEEEAALCRELGVELAFLDTVTNSSTRLLDEYRRRSEEVRA